MAPSVPTVDTGYEQRMAEWRAGGMTGNNSRSSSVPTLNLGSDNDVAMPQSLRSTMTSEPNWVVINGQRFTEGSNGKYNFPWSK